MEDYGALGNHMQEMSDDEWLEFYIEKVQMLSARHSRTILSSIGVSLDHEHYDETEQALYNRMLNQLWEKYRLPENRWPYSD